MRHNGIRDVTARLLEKVGISVSIELILQPLTGERLRYRTANVEDCAWLDVAANGLWGSRFERTRIDVRVLTLTHTQIDLHRILLCSSDPKEKREGTMRRGRGRLSKPRLFRRLCQPVAEWVWRQRHSTNAG